MKIYLSNSSIPELNGVSKQRQKEALKYGNKKALSHWQTILGIVLMAATVFLGMHFIGGMIGGGVGGGIGAFIYMQFMIPMSRPYIAEYLANHPE